MACLFQKIVSFDKESYFCIETINIKLSFHSMNFVEELKWRGMVHTMMPGTEELFEKGIVTAYLGIDPTRRHRRPSASPPPSRFASHRPLMRRYDAATFPTVRSQTHSVVGRCNRHDRRPVGKIART